MRYSSRELGFRKASLLVSHFNPRAKALYQSMGYRKVGYVPDAILPPAGWLHGSCS